MADIEKVIKALECCTAYYIDNDLTGHKRCPFNGLNDGDGCNKLYADALELLKEQKAENGEWITIWQEDDPDTSIHARCSICNRISERPLGGYCKWCGAKMSQEWGVDG